MVVLGNFSSGHPGTGPYPSLFSATDRTAPHHAPFSGTLRHSSVLLRPDRFEGTTRGGRMVETVGRGSHHGSYSRDVLEHARLLSHRWCVGSLLISPALRLHRTADGATGKKLFRGSSQRIAHAIRSTLPFQCTQHRILPSRARTKTRQKNDRTLGGFTPPFSELTGSSRDTACRRTRFPRPLSGHTDDPLRRYLESRDENRSRCNQCSGSQPLYSAVGGKRHSPWH